MKKLLIANWKMNPLSESEALKLARADDGPGVVIAPPFVFIPNVRKILKYAALGAQDVFFAKEGPYTGEVAVGQLKTSGVDYVIIGHSERRALGETDTLINKKVKTVLQSGLKAVLCVGEPWAVRKKGLKAAKNFVKKQLLADLKGIKNLKNLIIAYEPVWAIGTGKNDKPEETVQMVDFIKSFLRRPILYGGSVNAKNVQGFLREKSIAGALVGGASLKPAEFEKIVKLTVKH